LPKMALILGHESNKGWSDTPRQAYLWSMRANSQHFLYCSY
jgi:hypothetical protein